LRCDIDRNQLDETLLSELDGLDRAACALIKKAVALARHVTIVTNAEDEWVQQSAACFLPKVHAMLTHVEVCSARSKHENAFPSIENWKRIEYLERADSLASFSRGSFCASSSESMSTLDLLPLKEPSSPVSASPVDELARQLQFISIGDSEYERAAVFEVKKSRPNILVKSVKLLPAPTIASLTQQLKTVHGSLESIFDSRESLDLKLQPSRETSPKSNQFV